MNKKKKLLTVVTLVILMLGASVFTVSAADNHSVDENTTTKGKDEGISVQAGEHRKV